MTQSLFSDVNAPVNKNCDINISTLQWQCHVTVKLRVKVLPHPGRPPDSMWFANVTSSDHTSYCHFCKPITPQSTLPLWTPTRILTSTPVASRSLLQGSKWNGKNTQINTKLYCYDKHEFMKQIILECISEQCSPTQCPQRTPSIAGRPFMKMRMTVSAHWSASLIQKQDINNSRQMGNVLLQVSAH